MARQEYQNVDAGFTTGYFSVAHSPAVQQSDRAGLNGGISLKRIPVSPENGTVRFSCYLPPGSPYTLVVQTLRGQTLARIDGVSVVSRTTVSLPAADLSNGTYIATIIQGRDRRTATRVFAVTGAR